MPNHVKNVWKVKGIKPKDADTVLNKLAGKYVNAHTGKADYMMNFDLIIPEPRTIQDCPEKYRRNKDSHAEKLPNREWFGWYDWHIDKWGTKWNAYNGYTIVGKTYITFVFSTAWSFPSQVAKKVATLIGYDLDIKYADEDLGCNCGRISYDAHTKNWTAHDMTDSVRFARNLWNRY